MRRRCELGLSLPARVGTLDCTLCLACVQACPHRNVALVLQTPASELWDGRRRSGIGRLARRRDRAALVVVFTFAALLNAFGMTRPVYVVEQWLASHLATGSEALVLALVLAAGLVVVPAMVVGLAAVATNRVDGRPALSRRDGAPLRVRSCLLALASGWLTTAFIC